MTNQTLPDAFDRYLAARFTQADAITPGQKLAVIQTVRQETHEQGRVPLPGGPVRVDVANEAVQAALNGRAVAVDGQTIKSKPTSAASAEGLAGLSPGKKVAVMVGIVVVPLLLFILFLVARGGGEEAVIVETAVAVEAAANTLLGSVMTDDPTATPTPTETAISPSPAPEIVPTLPPPVTIIVTPTPFPALQINERGSVAGAGNDPASLEVAGFAYILTTGSVNNGLWEPRGAEWLQGTELRRVVTVPYNEELLQSLFSISTKETIKLRLRSGEIVQYNLSEVARVGQTEIEVLSAPYPSIVIILHGEEASDTRWVVIGEAVQAHTDFAEYGRVPAPVSSANAEPEFTIVDGQEMTADDLTLTVESCSEIDQLDGQTPPGSQQRFITCDITLEVLAIGLDTQEDVAITEQSWAASAPGWLPFQTIHTHSLNAGDALTLTVTGVVNQSSELDGESQPVLLWQRADATYLFNLSIFE